MKTSFELVAEFRETQGKGASRRLRHEGKVPAILYGGHSDARALTLSHQKLSIMLENERFYSTILSLKVGDETQAAILKDVQRHPFKNAVAAHRFSTSRREREDPHQHSAALQGRGDFAGRQIPGRPRLAHAQRSRSRVLAQGPAGIHRGRHFGTVAQREHSFVAAEDTGRRACWSIWRRKMRRSWPSTARVRKSRSRRRRRRHLRRRKVRHRRLAQRRAAAAAAAMRRRRPSPPRPKPKKEPAKKDAKK